MEKISNGILEVQIAETGAELRSIRKDGAEYLWQGDEKHWKRHAPLLFPFVGRLTEKRYVYKGESYEMSSHGFAPTSAFAVASNNGDAADEDDNWLDFGAISLQPAAEAVSESGASTADAPKQMSEEEVKKKRVEEYTAGLVDLNFF